MKKFFAVIPAVLLLACSGSSGVDAKVLESSSAEDTDTLLTHHQETYQALESLNKQSDSALVVKVGGTVEKIQRLTTENKALKEENKVLKIQNEELHQIITNTTAPADPVDDGGESYRLRAISDN